jgi:hypothetical protein
MKKIFITLLLVGFVSSWCFAEEVSTAPAKGDVKAAQNTEVIAKKATKKTKETKKTKVSSKSKRQKHK